MQRHKPLVCNVPLDLTISCAACRGFSLWSCHDWCSRCRRFICNYCSRASWKVRTPVTAARFVLTFSYYRTPQIDILSFVKREKQTLFCHLQTLEDISHLRFIKGNYVGVSLVNNISVPSLVNWRDTSIKKLQLAPDLQVRPLLSCLDNYCSFSGIKGWSNRDAYVRYLDRCR